VDTLVRQRGGTAPNIAYTLALLGERPQLMATVGEDFAEYRAWLESHGVDTTFARIVPGKYTASFFANTDLANSQIASFYAGAMADAGELSISDICDQRIDLVVISPNDPGAMKKYARECQELGIPYLYDPSQQVVRIAGEDLRAGVEGAQSLFVNEYEFELLQKHTGMTAREIMQIVKVVVVTLGSKGANSHVGGELIHVDAVPQDRIVDPTGVGDAFRGSFLAGWRKGLDWQTCGQIGGLAATYCLEQDGPQNHTFTPSEFIRRYRQHFDDKGRLDIFVKS